MSDAFSEKMAELEDITERLAKLMEASKLLRARKTELSDWVKGELEKKANEDSVQKVQAVFDNTTYTVQTDKKYKAPAPTQKQIPNLLKKYFESSDFDIHAFVTLSPQDKAKSIHQSIWGNREYKTRTSLSRKKN